MARLIKVCLLLAFIIISINYQAYGYQDIQGWDQAGWGATQADIAKHYQLQPWVAEGTPRCDAVERVTINGISFRVRFFFDARSDAGRLSQVALIGSAAMVDDKAFVGLISSKYGPPDHQARGYRGGNIYSWFRPSGRVELKIERSIAVAGEMAVIIHYLSTAGDKDKI